MFNYMAFLHGGIEKAGDKPIEDGRILADHCLVKLKQIDNQEQFPPKLLFLLVSASYLGGENSLDEVRARHLIAGIHQGFQDAGHWNIPLIGSTVAAVFYDNKIYHGGAVLACLGSRLLDVRVAVGPNVSSSAEDAVKTLLDGLDVKHSLGEYPRPFPNRALLTFFPGTDGEGITARHSTDKLHELLLEKLTYQIPIVGGVSTAGDHSPQRRGLQFVNRQSFTDTLAACLILSGVPVGTSLAKGLQPTGRVLHVENLSSDGKTIEKFYEGTPEEVFKDISEEIFKGRPIPILLKDLPPGSDYVRAKCLPDNGYKVVNVLREVRRHAALEITTPTPKRMYEETKKAHGLSLKRANINDPIGCLSFKCTGHYGYRDALGLDLESGIAAMGRKYQIPSYIGGFFDGEVGTDDAGSSVCGGWSVAAIIFGDEVSERTAVESGFDSLAQHGVKLAGTFDLEEDLQQSLELIYDLGFPGTMISVRVPDQDEMRFVPLKAKGSHCEKLLALMREDGDGDHLTDGMEHDKQPVFIPDPSLLHNVNQKVINESGMTSQYVLPLLDPDQHILAILRVELGDVKTKEEIPPALAKVLKPIAAIIGAAINRIFTWEENRIARKLDNALKVSLPSKDIYDAYQLFLKHALDAFGLRMGHVRAFDPAKNTLNLEAGVGRYHDAASEHRLKPDIGDWSPSCQAYTEDEATIVNDANNNSAHQAMCKRYAAIPAMSEALGDVGSYANIPFKNELGVKVGTFSLISDRPWFFLEYHWRALFALRRRLGFLVDHFTQKEREAEAHRRTEVLSKHLTFLLDVSPKLYQISDFSKIHQVLGEATKSFCRAAKAEYASLYVWDDDQAQYILRAESGWQSKGWIDAARYERNSQWIGNRLAGRPLIIKNLYEYYLERNYEDPKGRYAKEIFGRELSNEFSVEAIAVPLLVGGERLGALTLYRAINPIWPDKPSGFAITDIDLLNQGGNHIAGLVKLLLSHQTIRFDRAAQERQKNIHTAVTPRSDGVGFEAGICKKVLDEFNASSVDFYSLIQPNSPNKILWMHGLHVASGEGRDISLHQPPDMVTKVALRKKVKTRSRHLSAAQRKDPKQAVIEGFIERACIPLLAAGSLVGVLNVRWDDRRIPDASLNGKQGVEHLSEIGQMIGSAYWRHRLTLQQKQAEDEAEVSRYAVQAVGAMVFQIAHRLTNQVQTLYRRSLSIKEAKDEQSRDDAIARMSTVISEVMNQVRWPMDMAQRIQRLTTEKCCLRDLVDKALGESEDSELPIQRSLSVPDDIFVLVNPEHTKEALLNLINNAVRAMSEKPGGELRLSASVISGKNRAQLIIEDTGVGMTQEEVDNARRGFFEREGHTGVGVLISSVLLNVQGGTLKFDTIKGVGTKAIITLPLE